ncbi:MAG TPA: class I SAM-dependent methyltransferase [Actinomycetota bacterium]|nr:class I SAM-dependent methyltransferase [Actinomycetota bacterium]
MQGLRTAPSSPARTARALFSGLPATYDRMGAALSLGQDRRWRRFLASRVSAPPGGRVLDVATGTAAVAIEVASWTVARVTGLDLSEPMIRRGVERATEAGFDHRIVFVLGQGERLPFADETFDGVTFTYLLRYVEDPASTLRELARVLRAGGTLAGLEFHVPPRRVWRAGWQLYTRGVMPVVGRVVSKPWYEVGRFLGPSISRFYGRYPLEDQLEMWRTAGIRDVGARVMSLGGGVVLWGSRS